MRIIDKCIKLYTVQQYEVFSRIDPNQYFPKRYWLMSAETYVKLFEEVKDIYVLKWDSFVNVNSLFDISIRFDATVLTDEVQLAFILESRKEGDDKP